MSYPQQVSILAVAILFAIWLTPTHAVLQQSINPKNYLTQLIKHAEEKNLHKHPTWESLILYKRHFLRGIISQVDDPKFFLSHNGKTKPQQELAATLTAFLTHSKSKSSSFSAQCRFPARFFWLRQQLNFDPTQMPIVKCTGFRRFYQRINPKSVTLIYASTHPNRPASLFGHTLLRFDRKNPPGSTHLLDYTISYAADIAPGINLPAYIIRGIGGGFAGRYSIFPYYSKVRQYLEMDNRDIWEYELNLTPEQIKFVLMHVYELNATYFQYFFFTENCSYHLLSLLDVAYPNQKPTEHGNWLTVPVNIIKLLQKRHMIRRATFLPSLSTVVGHQLKQLPRQKYDLVKAIYRKGVESQSLKFQRLSGSDKAQVLDTVDLLHRYHDNRGLDRANDILHLRSKIKLRSAEITVPTPTHGPEQGHHTTRVGIGNEQISGADHLQLEWRASYHDLLDPSDGFIYNAALEVGRIKLNVDQATEKIRVQQFSIFNIVSITPTDGIFNQSSWHMHLNHQKKLFQQRWQGINQFDGGMGISLRWRQSNRHMFFVYADMSARQGSVFQKDYSLLAGSTMGIISEPVHGWRWLAQASYLSPIAGDSRRHTLAKLSHSFRITANTSVRIHTEREQFLNQYQNRIGLTFYYHYY